MRTLGGEDVAMAARGGSDMNPAWQYAMSTLKSMIVHHVWRHALFYCAGLIGPSKASAFT
jgi:hypothetical protein